MRFLSCSRPSARSRQGGVKVSSEACVSDRQRSSLDAKRVGLLFYAAAIAIPSCTAAPTTPSPPSSPSPASFPPTICQGIQVAPGDNIQSLINANPERTTFCFASGTYTLWGTIWTGEKYPILDLRAGAVIDGQHGGFVGINGPDSPASRTGTTILGGVFQHFGNAGAPIWVSSLIVRRNTVVEGTEFKENFNSGLAIQGSNARVTDVHTHHNGRYGLVVTPPCVGCPGPVGVVIEDSEIAFNNTRRLPTNNDAGGTKFTHSDGMIVRGNHVYNNYGSGLWWDAGNRNAQVYDNVITNNRNWGIVWELSYGGTRVFGNTLTDNGLSDGSPNFFDGVQLLVSASDGNVGGIEIYENTIDGAAYALGLINHSTHPTRTRNVHVHDNLMVLRASTTRIGGVAFDGLTELFSPTANNRFEHNTYRVVDPDATYWVWNGQTLTWRQWQSLGHDVNGDRVILG